jgi:hypothetical protein
VAGKALGQGKKGKGIEAFLPNRAEFFSERFANQTFALKGVPIFPSSMGESLNFFKRWAIPVLGKDKILHNKAH